MTSPEAPLSPFKTRMTQAGITLEGFRERKGGGDARWRGPKETENETAKQPIKSGPMAERSPRQALEALEPCRHLEKVSFDTRSARAASCPLARLSAYAIGV